MQVQFFKTQKVYEKKLTRQKREKSGCLPPHTPKNKNKNKTKNPPNNQLRKSASRNQFFPNISLAFSA